MKSSIVILPTDNNEVLPAAPDTSVLLSSKDLWTGIKVEHHVLQPNQMPEHVIQEHRLIINVGQPVNFEWKNGNKWQSKLYKTGDFALLSHGVIDTPRWDKEFNFIAVALSPVFTNTLIEIDNFSFTEQRGISDSVIHDIGIKFLQELKQENLSGKIYGESLAVAFAIHLASNYSATNKKFFAPKGKLSSMQLNKIIDYSKSLLSENIGLNELSKEANLSPFHFTRLFKQTLGLSPHQFVLQLKIERAKQVIKQRKLSLTEIAYELGFTDQAHFTNAFKKAVGVTPKQFQLK